MRRLMPAFILLFTLALMAQESGGQSWDLSDARPERVLGPGQELLLSTLPGLPATPYGITSQSFTGDVNQYQTFAADDFLIDNMVLGWRIEDVLVEGVYFGGGSGPADSVNVFILKAPDGQDTPPTTVFTGPDVVFTGMMLGFTDTGSGDFQVTLPNGGPLLPPGRYWLIVQAEMAISPGGQWGWAESALTPDSGVGVGLESAWFQTEPFVVSGNCTDAWGRRISDCDNRRTPNDGTLDEPDLAFALMGRSIPKLVALTPSSGLRTSENGGTDQYEVVLTEQPTSDVTIDISSDQSDEVLIDTTGGPMASQTLVFTPVNWSQIQTVTLLGQDDGDADGAMSFNMSHTTQSLDDRFEALPFLTSTGSNIDNECNTPSNFMDQLPDFPNWIDVPELIQALCLIP